MDLVLHLGDNHTSEVRGVSWSPDGGLLAAGRADGSIRLWATTTWHLVSHVGLGAAVNVLAWSPDSRLLVFGTEDGGVGLIRRAVLERVEALPWPGSTERQPITALAWSPFSRFVAIGYRDGVLIVGDPLQSEAAVRYLTVSGEKPSPAHDDTVTALSFSWDGRVLVSKGRDGQVRFWRCDSWEAVAVLSEPSGRYTLAGLAWNPRGPVLATLGPVEPQEQAWHEEGLADRNVRL
jgi:WD40 repeat protein